MDGRNNKLDTTGEQQLNTPEPVDISGFEFDGSLGGLIVPSDNPRNANTKNHISNASIITMTGEESSNYRFSMHGSKGDQPFELKLCPATPPADFNTSWQFEPYPETAINSEMSYLTPHQSPSGVASPGSSSGVSSEAEEPETCVDVSKLVNEANDYSTSFTEEIEQLSESFDCKEEDLISIQNFTVDGNSSILLKVFQEEDSNASDGSLPPSVSNGTVYDTRSSVATKFLSDADKDDEDYYNELAKAAARTPATLQSVSCKEDTLDLKTQTQLEHNYTIKLPPLVVDAGNPGHILTTNTTLVKEPALIPRDSTAILSPQQQPPKRPQPAVSMKRQLFQRTIKTEMAAEGKLKLKMPTASAPIVAPVGILSTPDLTKQVLELEAEAELLSAEDQFDLLSYISSGTDYDVVPISPVEEKPSVIKAEPVQPASTICPNELSQLLSNPPKRKRPVITLENLDELTSCTTAKKYRSSASSSTASSVCGDSISEATSSASANKKRRGRPPKQTSLQLDPSFYQDLNEEDQRYREQRDKNNEASRKSRINRRDRELKLEHEANALNQQYEELKNDEKELIRECAKWRRAVMRLALL